MRIKDRMLAVAAAYGKAVGRSESWVSLQIFGSGKRLRELREGADTASHRVEDALQWFSDRWPEGVSWLEGIERPPVTTPEGAATE